MRLRSGLLIVLAGLLAGVLGLAASVAVYGPGPLLASPLGQVLDRIWPSSADGTVAIGDAVEPWTLPDLEAGRSTLPVAGQATLINYWASWCGPCREELPLLAELSRDPKAGLAVRAIALDSPDEARRFLTEQRLELPVPVETPGPQDSSIRLGNRASVLPFSVLIDAQGRLRARKTGAFHSRAELQSWIKQGLAAP
jgi:thiol-disulfide isomerase/thioredoxin